MKLKTEQEFAIIEEGETGIFLLVEGLIAWDQLNGANDFRHLPLQLVSQGLERLLKLTMILAEVEQGRLPTHDEVKRYGHRLTALTNRLARIMEESGYSSSRPAATDDLAFIREDSDFGRLLRILSSFGDQGRYYNLDALLQGDRQVNVPSDPISELAEFESEIMQRIPGWEHRIRSDFDSLHQHIHECLVALIQRFARAICRIYTLGPLGERGKRLTATVGQFLYLNDDDLAVTPKRWFEK